MADPESEGTDDRTYPQLLPWVGEERGRRVAHLLLALWLLSLADLFFTLWAHFFTPFYELNPIARALLASNQITWLVLMKLMLTSTGTWRMPWVPM